MNSKSDGEIGLFAELIGEAYMDSGNLNMGFGEQKKSVDAVGVKSGTSAKNGFVGAFKIGEVDIDESTPPQSPAPPPSF